MNQRILISQKVIMSILRHKNTLNYNKKVKAFINHLYIISFNESTLFIFTKKWIISV